MGNFWERKERGNRRRRRKEERKKNWVCLERTRGVSRSQTVILVFRRPPLQSLCSKIVNISTGKAQSENTK